ncbi:hypothetical protein MJ585_08035 [Klebsiella pneumoniae]|nr:hypothetical protein MJ585_08035 [Klebsiella pneumoniae]
MRQFVMGTLIIPFHLYAAVAVGVRQQRAV